MDYKELLFLLLSYFVLIILGSLFVMGFYIISRSHPVEQPDGTIKDYGKILKFWSIFWEKISRYDQCYYRNETLEKKFKQITRLLPQFKNRLVMDKGGKCLVYTEPLKMLTEDDIYIIETTLLCKINAKDEFVFIYEEIPVYRFNDMARYPLSECPPCMSSVFGSIFYWSVQVITDFNQFQYISHPILGIIVFWILFCISCSFITYILSKI